MTPRNIITFSLPLLAAVVLALFGVSMILQYKSFGNLASQNEHLRHGIEIAEQIDDQDEAVEYYKSLKPSIPEVQLRILQGQWLIALEIIHQTQLSRNNPVLAKDVPQLFDTLKDHLEDMKDRANFLLADIEPSREDIAWRVHTIKGSVGLMMAFIILETERNWKKVIGIMKEALSDLKAAVDVVDRASQNTFERNIPRWNLEVLHGEQYVRTLTFTKLVAERRLELRENLEAIIPEKGGYLPGEPRERKIQK